MKQANPWNEILAAFRLEFHPGKSACGPNSKEFVSSSSIPDLKGCKTGEQESCMEVNENFTDWSLKANLRAMWHVHAKKSLAY